MGHGGSKKGIISLSGGRHHSGSFSWRCHSIAIDLALTVVSTVIGVAALYGVAGLTDVGLLDAASLTRSLSLACPIVTMVQFVAPAPLVIDAIKKMSGQGLPSQAFVSQAGCNVLGIAYGIQITNSAVLFTNLFGLGCQTLFLAADHLVRSTSSGSWVGFAVKLCICFNSVLVLMTVVAPINILGHAITGLNIFLYASPLAKVAPILRTRNASGLPMALTCISVANNALWTLYALMIQDAVVLVPSVLGYMLSAFQVMVILWCHGLLPFDLAFLLLLCRDSKQGGGKSPVEDDELISLTELGKKAAE